MSEEGKTYLVIHYGGHEFHLQDDAAARRAVKEIDEAQRTGALVTFSHTGGQSSIAVGNGTPVVIHYANG